MLIFIQISFLGNSSIHLNQFTNRAYRDLKVWLLITDYFCYMVIIHLLTTICLKIGSLLIMERCSMCHAAEPGWDDMSGPPKGIVLETPEDIERQAQLIYLQAGRSTAMPPGSVIELEAEERARIVAWYEDRP